MACFIKNGFEASWFEHALVSVGAFFSEVFSAFLLLYEFVLKVIRLFNYPRTYVNFVQFSRNKKTERLRHLLEIEQYDVEFLSPCFREQYRLVDQSNYSLNSATALC